jgi:hypothetical protein
MLSCLSKGQKLAAQLAATTATNANVLNTDDQLGVDPHSFMMKEQRWWKAFG